MDNKSHQRHECGVVEVSAIAPGTICTLFNHSMCEDIVNVLRTVSARLFYYGRH